MLTPRAHLSLVFVDSLPKGHIKVDLDHTGRYNLYCDKAGEVQAHAKPGHLGLVCGNKVVCEITGSKAEMLAIAEAIIAANR